MTLLDLISSDPAKRSDSRYRWFVERYGTRCWELDAMNPNDLRDRVEAAVGEYVDWDIWERCQRAEAAEKESICTVVGKMINPGLASKKSSQG